MVGTLSLFGRTIKTRPTQLISITSPAPSPSHRSQVGLRFASYSSLSSILASQSLTRTRTRTRKASFSSSSSSDLNMTSTKSDQNKPKQAQNRQDLLTPSFDPYPPVSPLGQSQLHGPKREEHLVIVLGVGPGLGLAIAKVFAQQGYAVAIMSRNKERLDSWAKELDSISKGFLKSNGLQVPDYPLSKAFACDVLKTESIKGAVKDALAAWPDRKLGTACYNASVRKRGPFLEQKEEQVRDGVEASIFAGFTFSQSVVGAMSEHGQGGSLLVTGATSSTRGREGFAGFAASKSGLRVMCQSISREFSPQMIHVCHIVVDGIVESHQALDFLGLPKGSHFQQGSAIRPEEAAKTWLFIAQQDSSGWIMELELRPAKEKF